MAIRSAKLKRIAKEYREGIAEAIGVPPDAIRDDIVEKWVDNWVKVFVKPGFVPALLGQSDSPAKKAGKYMGELLKDLGRRYPELFRT